MNFLQDVNSTSKAPNVRQQFLNDIIDTTLDIPHDFYQQYRLSSPDVKTSLDAIISSIKYLFLHMAGRRLSSKEIPRELQNVPASTLQIIQSVYEARYEDLRRGLVLHAASFSPSILKDFDFYTNIILSSNQMNTMASPRLILQLSEKTLNGDDNNFEIELTKDELDHLLSEFEKIDTTLKQLE